MGPIIICDKSSIQAFNPAELNAFRRYFTLNIPPILLAEILGDLKKHKDPQAGQLEVKVLANKLVPATALVNVNFRTLIKEELTGYKFPMDGRPVLKGGKPTISPEGKRAMIFEETPEAAALLRWQIDKFNEAENLLAEMWRLSTASIDLEGMQKHLKGAYSSRLKLQTIDDTVHFVDDLMASAPSELLLEWFLRDIGISAAMAAPAVEKFKKEVPGSFKAAAPYTTFCIRTGLIFHFALAFGLVSTRATNRLDLEYFYYTPFCVAFSSGDNFHRTLARIIMREQVFADRDELKADLSGLAKWWANLSPEGREEENEVQGPPENESSITHRIWKKFMRPGYRKKGGTLPPEMAKQFLKEYQDMLKNGVPLGQNSGEPVGDWDFIMTRHNVRFDGPCICGSDKRFKDCCGRKIGVA